MSNVIGTKTITVVKITGSRSGVGKIIHTSPKKRCGVTTWCQFIHASGNFEICDRMVAMGINRQYIICNEANGGRIKTC